MPYLLYCQSKTLTSGSSPLRLEIAESLSPPDLTNDKIQLWILFVSAHKVCGFRFTHKNNSMRLNNGTFPRRQTSCTNTFSPKVIPI